MGTPEVQVLDQAPTARSGDRTIDLLWGLIAFSAPALVAFLGRLKVIDLAYQLRAGEAFLTTSDIPSRETWTFSVQGAPWTDQQWGAQAVLALVHRLGGWSALGIGRGLLIGLTFLIVYRTCRARGAPPRAAGALASAGFVIASPTLALRPQLLAVPLFAAALWCVVTSRDHPRRLFALPVCALLVANLHGSFVLFPFLAVVVLVDAFRERRDQVRFVAAIAGATVVATLINPFGVGVWRYVYDLSTNEVIRDTIREWAPVTFSNLSGWILFGSLVPLLIYLARTTRRMSILDLTLLVPTLVLALSAVRSLVWWGIVLPVVVAGLLAGDEAEDVDPSGAERSGAERSARAPAYVIAAALGLALLVTLPTWRSDERLLEEAPPGIAEAVAELPAGSRVFAPQPWGSWLEFAAPEQLVFVDPRIELFPEAIWADYDTVAFGEAGWEEVLRRWDPDAIVADRERWEQVLPLLRSLDGYRVAYEDADGAVFVRG